MPPPILKPLTIELPEHFLNVARAIAESEGIDVSIWAAEAVSEKLVRLAAQALAESERADPDAAARTAEIEAERDARWSAPDAE